MTRIWWVATVSLLAVANCGGGGGATNAGTTVPPTASLTAQNDPADYFSQVIAPGYTQYRSDLIGDTNTGSTGLPNTAFTGMPASGTATYNGYALLAINRDATVSGQPRLGVEGTATMTADFANHAISGSATNFVGGSVTGQDPTTGYYTPAGPANYYAGTIQITNGCIGNTAGCSGVTRPNQYSAQFSGALNGEGNSIVTSGSLLGDFKGTPIQGVTAITQTATTTVNGTVLPSGFFAFVKP